MIYLYQSKDKRFYFTVNAKNGQVLVTSETYNSKAKCMAGIRSLVKNIMVLVGSKGIIYKEEMELIVKNIKVVEGKGRGK